MKHLSFLIYSSFPFSSYMNFPFVRLTKKDFREYNEQGILFIFACSCPLFGFFNVVL